jgi:hypothetical protein
MRPSDERIFRNQCRRSADLADKAAVETPWLRPRQILVPLVEARDFEDDMATGLKPSQPFIIFDPALPQTKPVLTNMDGFC